MDATGDLLRMRGIRKSFGATHALAGVDLTVGAGEVVALIGENGAGKSTLMKVLTGEHRPDGGTMELAGLGYAPRDPLDARARGFAIVHQELSIVPHLSVAENILLGRSPSRFGFVDRAAQRRMAAAALDELGVELPLDARAGTLPLAAQQLVEISRVLVAPVRLAVFDEPTSSLSRSDAGRLYAAVARLRARGVGVVWISHFLDECRTVASRFCVLRDGASVATGELAGTTDGELIRHMVGRPLGELHPRVAHEIGGPVLEISRLSGEKHPRELSFTVRSGEILGIFGIVGAGRSETLRAIFGLDRPRAGTVALHGRLLAPGAPPQRWRAGMGMVSEDRKGEGLMLGRSIADNICLTRLGPYRRAGLLSPRRQQDGAGTWMARCRVKAASPAQRVGELSGGNQQKVAVARLLHHGAEVLLLDEPTRGVDIGARADLYRLIGEQAAAGAAVIIASSDIGELLGICDTVAAMCRGSLGPRRTAEEWDPHSLLAAAIGSDDV